MKFRNRTEEELNKYDRFKASIAAVCLLGVAIAAFSSSNRPAVSQASAVAMYLTSSSVAGSAESGAAIHVRMGDTVVGETKADENGQWEFKPSKPLEGEILAEMMDAGGGVVSKSDPLRVSWLQGLSLNGGRSGQVQEVPNRPNAAEAKTESKANEHEIKVLAPPSITSHSGTAWALARGHWTLKVKASALESVDVMSSVNGSRKLRVGKDGYANVPMVAGNDDEVIQVKSVGGKTQPLYIKVYHASKSATRLVAKSQDSSRAAVGTMGRMVTPRAKTWGTITIQEGDTLVKLARELKVSWKRLYKLNRRTIHSPDLIYAGSRLKVPLRR